MRSRLVPAGLLMSTLLFATAHSATANPSSKTTSGRTPTPSTAGSTSNHSTTMPHPTTTHPTTTTKHPTTQFSASQVAKELSATESLLAGALHDYDGHRAKAMEEIRTAIQALTPQTGSTTSTEKTGTTSTTKPTGTGQPAAGESQVTSDNKLKQALSQLTAIETQIGTHNSKASSAVAAAAKELNTALSIK